MAQPIEPVVLVHGGAGDMDPSREEQALAGCEDAAEAGRTALLAGESVLEAVVRAVRCLEDNPHFNAGIGAVLTRKGTVEVDAALMRGSDLAVGAVAALPNGGGAIELARQVLMHSEHSLLSGDAAWEFLKARGLSPTDPASMITERSLKRLERERLRRSAGKRGEPDPGTVGAVAVDAEGRVAAATSTGGTTYKRCGRIGDTPLIGCGTYADDFGGACSATGHGESIIAIAMASVANHSMIGRDAQQSADVAVKALDRVSGKAGIICVDRHGGVGSAHNTKTMPVAFARGEQDVASRARR